MSYLLDANTLIDAKNRYYHMAICPGFWQWILQKNQLGTVASIDIVADELLCGNDELKQWVEVNRNIFIPVSDEPTQGHLEKPQSWHSW